MHPLAAEQSRVMAKSTHKGALYAFRCYIWVWKVTRNVSLLIGTSIKKVLFLCGIPKHIKEYEACLHRILIVEDYICFKGKKEKIPKYIDPTIVVIFLSRKGSGY